MGLSQSRLPYMLMFSMVPFFHPPYFWSSTNTSCSLLAPACLLLSELPSVSILILALSPPASLGASMLLFRPLTIISIMIIMMIVIRILLPPLFVLIDWQVYFISLRCLICTWNSINPTYGKSPLFFIYPCFYTYFLPHPSDLHKSDFLLHPPSVFVSA